MCIAIIKEYGVPLPTKDILKRCFRNNPDGAGYAYLTEADQWHVHKGLQTWPDFWNAFEEEKFTDENTVAIHFRVGTSGKMVDGKCYPGCTHPFPVSDDKNALMKHRYTADNIILHNGVVGRGDGYLSDTQMAVIRYAYPLVRHADQPGIMDILSDCLDAGPKGSRWWVAKGNMYWMLGDWILDQETKIWYSNDGYRPFEAAWPTYRNNYTENWLSGWDMADDDGTNVETVSTDVITFLSGSRFDWDKFKQFHAEVKQLPQPVNLVPDIPRGKTNDCTQIYNMNGQLVGLVDEDGNVIWDDDDPKPAPEVKESFLMDEDDDTLDRDYQCEECSLDFYERELLQGNKCPVCGNHCEYIGAPDYVCPECHAELDRYQLNDGTCPWCYAQVLQDEDYEKEVVCPNCNEKNHHITISLARYPDADTECARCGCYFQSPLGLMATPLGYNLKRKDEYEQLIRAVLGAD